MEDMHRYEINLKQGDLFISLSSGDVYFISKQMDKWFKVLLDDSYVPITIQPGVGGVDMRASVRAAGAADKANLGSRNSGLSVDSPSAGPDTRSADATGVRDGGSRVRAV